MLYEGAQYPIPPKDNLVHLVIPARIVGGVC